jgi:uncharacterized protein YdhG (YjbR/CyaY superfamily)
MKRPSKPARIPKSFDDYLAALRPDQSAVLQRLRKAIHSSAPNAEECISYGMPAFRLNGRFFVGLAATAKHCAFYLGSTVQRHMDKLAKYDVSKGTIRFQAIDPMSSELVRVLVEARIVEFQQNRRQRPADRTKRKTRS